MALGVFFYNEKRVIDLNYQNNNEYIGLVLNLLSVLLAQENLIENRQQSKQNDVQAANDKQAKFLLDEINRKFEEQNQMLREILERLGGNNG